MKTYCKISNAGEVDVNAFRLMGASTKEGDSSKIGFFGSGIKYAIATALREDIEVRVFSGAKEIKIGKRKTTMAGQPFDVVTINGSPTSITTRMGKDWQNWFIFRELYCNAIDEGNEEMSVADQPVGEKGRTCIYIELNGKMKPVFDSFAHYFSKKREALHESDGTKVYRRIGEKMTVYRKGIRVYHEHESMFDYDFPTLAINESRVCSDFEAEWHIVGFWKQNLSSEMLASLINNRDSYEYRMDWSYSDPIGGMSSVWLEYLARHTIIPHEYGGYFADDQGEYHVTLPHKLCVALHNSFGDKLKIRGFQDSKAGIVVLQKTDKQEAVIAEAVDFLRKGGIEDVDSFPIQVAALGKSTLGQAEGGNIYLSEMVFEKGKRQVVETLLEEYVHVKTHLGDRSRGMQDYLLQIAVTALESKSGIYL